MAEAYAYPWTGRTGGTDGPRGRFARSARRPGFRRSRRWDAPGVAWSDPNDPSDSAGAEEPTYGPRGRGRSRSARGRTRAESERRESERHGHRHGHHGPEGGFGPGRGRRRAGRGNVRAAVLTLLAEEPQHGYALLGQIAERSGGLWRPSPGSIYPLLAQLQDEGLVASDDDQGRRVFRLTDEGRAYVDEHSRELTDPWETGGSRRDHAATLFEAVRSLGGAAREVARNGGDEQVRRARDVISDARKALYRILAEDETTDTDDKS